MYLILISVYFYQSYYALFFGYCLVLATKHNCHLLYLLLTTTIITDKYPPEYSDSTTDSPTKSATKKPMNDTNKITNKV